MITSSRIILISTEEAAPTPLAHFCMCVADVGHKHIPQRTARKRNSNNKVQYSPWQQQQLQEDTYVPQTPLKHRRLAELLQFHPDSEKVNYVLQGLDKGFSLEYHGNFKFRAPKNLPTAQIDPKLIQEKLAKEVRLGRMLGPFSEPPFMDLMCLLITQCRQR